VIKRVESVRVFREEVTEMCVCTHEILFMVCDESRTGEKERAFWKDAKELS
jgi:hypothetical protein